MDVKVYKFLLNQLKKSADRVHVIVNSDNDENDENEEKLKDQRPFDQDLFALQLISPTDQQLYEAIANLNAGLITHLVIHHSLAERCRHWSILRCFIMLVDDNGSSCITYVGPSEQDFIERFRHHADVFQKL